MVAATLQQLKLNRYYQQKSKMKFDMIQIETANHFNNHRPKKIVDAKTATMAARRKMNRAGFTKSARDTLAASKQYLQK